MENLEELKIKKSIYESFLFEFWVRERERSFIENYKDNPKFTVMEDQATVLGPFILFLSTVSVFAEEKGFIENNCGKNKFAIFSVDNYQEAEEVVNFLKEDEEFLEKYIDEPAEIILQSYLDYYREKEEKELDLSSLVAQIYFGEPLNEKQTNIINKTAKQIVEVLAGELTDLTDEEKAILEKKFEKIILNIAKVLAKKYFPKKLKLDYVGVERFKGEYQREIGEEFLLKDNDSFLKTFIRLFDNYLKDENNFCIIDRALFEKFLWELTSFHFQTVTSPNYSIFYYKPLYENYLELLNEAGIKNEEMMVVLLKEYLPSLIYKKDYFVMVRGYERISSFDEITFIENKICSVKSSNFSFFARIEEIDQDSEMKFIPVGIIEKALKNGSLYIKNKTDEYILKSSFNITEEQKNRLIKNVNWFCEKYNQASFDHVDVIDELKRENDQFSDFAFRQMIFENLGDDFEKQGQNIVRKGQSEAFSTFLKNYLKECEHTTLSDLQDLAKKRDGKMETKRILDIALNAMVRINANDFVADKFLDFDIERIDKEGLDKVIKDDFIGLKEVSSAEFDFYFPPLNKYKWNTFLLESYCRRFSKKYKYVVLISNSKGVGAIVDKKIDIKTTADYQNYYKLLARAVLRDRNVEIEYDDIADFLVNRAGYIAEVNQKRIVPIVIDIINKMKEEK